MSFSKCCVPYWNNKKGESNRFSDEYSHKPLCKQVLINCLNYYDLSMFPHLYGFRVNISLFQEAASKELLEILEKCEGTKVCNLRLFWFDFWPNNEIHALFFTGNCLGWLFIGSCRFSNEICIPQRTKCHKNATATTRPLAGCWCSQYYFHNATKFEAHELHRR